MFPWWIENILAFLGQFDMAAILILGICLTVAGYVFVQVFGPAIEADLAEYDRKKAERRDQE